MAFEWIFSVRASVTMHHTSKADSIRGSQLSSETVVFVLTMVKVVEQRANDRTYNPLMNSLHYGQVIYNVVSSPPNHLSQKQSSDELTRALPGVLSGHHRYGCLSPNSA